MPQGGATFALEFGQNLIGVATLIFGYIRPPTIFWEATEIRQSVTSTTLRCEETPGRHWLLANAYAFLVSSVCKRVNGQLSNFAVPPPYPDPPPFPDRQSTANGRSYAHNSPPQPAYGAWLIRPSRSGLTPAPAVRTTRWLAPAADVFAPKCFSSSVWEVLGPPWLTKKLS